MNTAALRFFCLLSTLFALLVQARAQTYDLTMDVLVNSANAAGYNPSAQSPGEYQRYPERYFEHLQIPYRVIDTATQAPPANLGSAQLIVAAHRGLALSPAWQQAIASAAAGGTGFVNLDSDPAVGANAHMEQIFGATGSAAGAATNVITVPSAVAAGGATPHYIAAMQLRFASTPAGDLTYTMHQNASGVTNPITPTVLTGARGTVIAQAGASPLILATQTAAGRAVDFTTYDFMRPDRFGFVMGLDDLFWRSLVWAARKPFVLRGYPRYFALQMDDEVADWPNRFPDLWNTGYTGPVQADGTGGPWKATAMAQFVDLTAGGGDRAVAISEIKAGNLKVAFHTQTGASDGDLYWNPDSPTPLTDAQWESNLAVARQVMQGQGGNDVLPPLSKSMNPHFWNLSNNVGYDMWNTFGTRYITEIQQPGTSFDGAAKTDAQRIAGRPFRLYELPPSYGEPNEIWPMYTADDLVVGSTAGLPPVTFFSFCTQLLGYDFPTFDAKWPSTSDGYSVAYSVDNFTEYAWRFWSSMAPVEVYSHDGGNYEKSTAAQRQQAITQISAFLNARGVRHLFMENMGAYMRARVKSVLTAATATPSNLSLTFTGGALDADGNQIPTYFYTFYGDDEGVLQQVPGFSNGYTYTTVNNAPPRIALTPAQLQFAGVPGGAATGQSAALTNTGNGTLPFTTQTDSAWLSASPASGVAPSTLTVTADPSSLSAGTYTGNVTVLSGSAVNSPQTLPVTFTVRAPSLGVAPQSLAFAGAYNGATPAAKTLSIANTGGGQLTWSAAGNASWLKLSPASGVAPSTLSVTADTTGLGVGTYTGTITVTAAGSLHSPQQINVTLSVANLLLQSNFPGTALSGWAYSTQGTPANWSVASNTLTYTGSGPAQIYAGNVGWTDLTFQIGFQLSSTSNYPGGLRARVNPATGAGYAVFLYPADGLIRLFRTPQWDLNGSGVTQIGVSGPLTFDTAQHTLALAAQGSGLTVLYDGASVLTATDATYPTGMVALEGSSQPLRFMNALVSSSLAETGTLGAAANSLSFSLTAGASGTQQAALSVSDGSSAAFSLVSSASWLSATPSSGTTPAALSVAANAGSLAAGTYNAAIQVSSYGSANPTYSLPVSLTVTSGAGTQQTVSPTGLSFSAQAGGAAPAAQSLSVTTTPAGAPYSVSTDQAWLTAAPASGTTPGTLSVAAAPGKLTAGTYSGNVTVSVPSATNPTVRVPVSFTIASQSAAALLLAPTTLNFVGATMLPAPAQTARLTSTPANPAVSWQAAHASTWLSVSPATGITPAALFLGANTTGLPVGSYTDTLQVTGPGIAALSVPIALRVGTLLFSDTFADRSRWTASPQGLNANWSIANNTFKYAGGSKNTQQYAGSSSWTDYTLQADIQLSTANNYPGGLRFRLNTSSGAGYAVWLYPGNSQVVLYRVGAWNIDASNSTLATAKNVALAAGLHHLRVDAAGSLLAVWVDNVKLLTATDASYAAGAIALDVSNQAVAFSNVSVIR